MGFYNQQVYAVSSLDHVASDFVYTFVNYFMSKFPNGTFSPDSIFVDYMGRVTDHKRTTEGLSNPRRIERPIAYFVFEEGITDSWNKEDKPDMLQYSMFPGTTNDRRIANNHRLIMLRDDLVGIHLDTIEIRRDFVIKGKMDFTTKGDLETCKNYMYSTFEINKHNYLDNFVTTLILPNVLVNDISKLAFQVDGKKHNIGNPHFHRKMCEYLNTYGAYTFDYKEFDSDYRENQSVYFLASRPNRISWRMGSFEGRSGSGGEKNGDGYSSFILEFEIKADFKLPASYVLNYKSFNAVNKEIVSDNYLKSHRAEVDKKAFVSVNNLEKYFIDTRRKIPRLDKGHHLIVREEFFIEEPTEIIPYHAFLFEDTPYWAVLERLTPKERDGIFYSEVYEDDYPIEPSAAIVEDIASDIICTISKCNPDHVFMFFLYVNQVKLDAIWPLILKRISDGVYPNVDENGNRLKIGSNPATGFLPNIRPWGPDMSQWELCIWDNKIWRLLVEDPCNNPPPGCGCTRCWERINVSDVYLVPPGVWVVAKPWDKWTVYRNGEYVIYDGKIWLAVHDEPCGPPPGSSCDKCWCWVMVRDLVYGGIDNMIDLSKQKTIGGNDLTGNYKYPGSQFGKIVTWDGFIHTLRSSGE